MVLGEERIERDGCPPGAHSSADGRSIVGDVLW